MDLEGVVRELSLWVELWLFERKETSVMKLVVDQTGTEMVRESENLLVVKSKSIR
jgi:hypothetical protein